MKWYSGEEIDGLTTNGVFIMQPQGGFDQSAKAGVWREVSVGGTVYALRESRSTPHKSSQVIQRTKIFKYCTCPAGRVNYNLSWSCKHMHLSFKSIMQ